MNGGFVDDRPLALGPPSVISFLMPRARGGALHKKCAVQRCPWLELSFYVLRLCNSRGLSAAPNASPLVLDR